MEENKNFIEVLNTRVDGYFENNNISKYGNFELYFKGILFISMYIANYFIILFLDVNIWIMWLLFMFLGFCIVLISLNVSHDAIHSSYSKRPWLNHFAELSFNLIGGNSYIFKKRHLITHIDTDDADKRSSIQKQKFLMQYRKKGKSKNLPVFFYLFFSIYMFIVRDFVLFKNESSPIPKKEYFRL